MGAHGYRHVVVGNGAAAIHACRALRASGYEGEIHLFSDHPEAAYNPMLTAYYLAGRLLRRECFPFGRERRLYRNLGVDAYLGRPVTGLDVDRKVVVTAGGRDHRYDSCLVATGASPVRPPVPGIEGDRVHELRTMADADRLLAAVTGGARSAVVLGASLVGLKVTEALLARGLRVLLVDRAPQVLPLAAGEICAEAIAGRLRAAGVELLLGETAESLEEWDGGVRMTLTGGHVAFADVAVAATGVRPNRAFLDPRQVECGEGVLVDEHMRTSAPDVFAAGDVAQAPAPAAGSRRATGLWSQACLQGRIAGRNMAGGRDRYVAPLPHNIVHVIGLTFASAGEVRGPYTLSVHDEGRAEAPPGFELLDDCDAAGVARYGLARSDLARRAVRASVPRGAGVSPHVAWASVCDRMFRNVVGVAARATSGEAGR